MIPFHQRMETMPWRFPNPESPRAQTYGSWWVTFTAIALLLALLFAGCGAARPSRFYELSTPGNVGADSQADPYNCTVLMGPIFASHLYREDHIVYSSKGQSMGTYEYERWVEPPTEMIQEILFRALRRSRRFRSIYPQRSNMRGDYLLRGRLYDFKEITGSPMAARLSLDLELRETKTGNTVWTHSYSHDEPVSGKSVSALVEALDHNAQRATSEITASLFEYFAAHPPAPPPAQAQ
jgi:ABC-type uncharacterized transport system auxiliary subunit